MNFNTDYFALGLIAGVFAFFIFVFLREVYYVSKINKKDK